MNKVTGENKQNLWNFQVIIHCQEYLNCITHSNTFLLLNVCWVLVEIGNTKINKITSYHIWSREREKICTVESKNRYCPNSWPKASLVNSLWQDESESSTCIILWLSSTCSSLVEPWVNSHLDKTSHIIIWPNIV